MGSPENVHIYICVFARCIAMTMMKYKQNKGTLRYVVSCDSFRETHRRTMDNRTWEEIICAEVSTHINTSKQIQSLDSSDMINCFNFYRLGC